MNKSNIHQIEIRKLEIENAALQAVVDFPEWALPGEVEQAKNMIDDNSIGIDLLRWKPKPPL